MAAISWQHKINNAYDPSKSFCIKRMLKGVIPFQKEPKVMSIIDRDMLSKLLSLLEVHIFDNYEKILMRSILLTMYICCLRAGEAVVSTHDKHTIRIENVKIKTVGTKVVTITLKSYKHSNENKTFSFEEANKALDCPVEALLNYLAVRPVREGILFIDWSGKPVTRKFLVDTIRKLIVHTGNDPSDFGSHSIRAGRTTDLARAGVPEAIIKETGRWTSNAYQKYIRFAAFSLPR